MSNYKNIFIILNYYGFSVIDEPIDNVRTKHNVINASHYAEYFHELCHYFAASTERKLLYNFGLPLKDEDCGLQDFIDEYFATKIQYYCYNVLIDMLFLEKDSKSEAFINYQFDSTRHNLKDKILSLDPNTNLNYEWCETFANNDFKNDLNKIFKK